MAPDGLGYGGDEQFTKVAAARLDNFSAVFPQTSRR
jgi:hypothetical protein